MSCAILVVLSGGQDSTTCLAQVLSTKDASTPVECVTFDYGQRHRHEIVAARRVRAVAEERFDIKIPHHDITLPGVLVGTSPLVAHTTPVDRYDSAATLPGGLEKTFVPMRNALFLTVAANRAVEMAIRTQKDEAIIVTGVSQEDYGGYPDCRETFIRSIEHAFKMSLDDPGLPKVSIWTPLCYKNKQQTVELSESIEGAREMLAWSHTCYNGFVTPCGQCHACLLREKGYAAAGVTDPLLLRLDLNIHWSAL